MGEAPRSVRRGLSLAAAVALALVVAVLELAGRDGSPGPISALVLSTRLGLDGRPRPLPPPAGPAICAGPACGQADPGTQTMMENIKKVLHALDSRLGNIKDAERGWKSTMAHKVRMMSQQVGSLGSEEKKVYFLQQDVKRKLAARGPPGARGLPGTAGRLGINGGQGPQGASGPRGIVGVQGKQGPPGIIGAPGIRCACSYQERGHEPLLRFAACCAGISAFARGAARVPRCCCARECAYAWPCSWRVQRRHGASRPAGQAGAGRKRRRTGHCWRCGCHGESRANGEDRRSGTARPARRGGDGANGPQRRAGPDGICRPARHSGQARHPGNRGTHRPSRSDGQDGSAWDQWRAGRSRIFRRRWYPGAHRPRRANR